MPKRGIKMLEGYEKVKGTKRWYYSETGGLGLWYGNGLILYGHPVLKSEIQRQVDEEKLMLDEITVEDGLTIWHVTALGKLPLAHIDYVVIDEEGELETESGKKIPVMHFEERLKKNIYP